VGYWSFFRPVASIPDYFNAVNDRFNELPTVDVRVETAQDLSSWLRRHRRLRAPDAWCGRRSLTLPQGLTSADGFDVARSLFAGQQQTELDTFTTSLLFSDH
jgi:hypothetical protein